MFESWADAYAYKKANKLSGANIQFDADANLWKINNGNVTITKIGDMINKMYMVGNQIHLSQTRAGGGDGNSSKQNTKIESQMSRNYTNSGFRHFVNWEGWSYLNFDLTGNLGTIRFMGISSFNTEGEGDIKGKTKVINVTDMSSFGGTSLKAKNILTEIADSWQTISTGLSSGVSLFENFRDKNKDKYIRYKYKKYGIYEHWSSERQRIIGMSRDTMILQSQIQKFEKDHQYDSINTITKIIFYMIKKVNLFGNLILLLFLIFSCSDKNINKEYEGNTLNYEIDFPSTVYTNKIYKGKITFYNKFLDSIAEPRRDTANFRFIIYKPYKPYPYKDDFNPIYGDSILLDKNTIDIELKFDKAGIYNIGGFARDGMRINYYNNFGMRDSARFIEHEIIILKKVIVKDSI